MKGQSTTITAFDAKNRLGRLLDRVAAGEELVITRHGEPVARLVPVSNDDQSNPVDPIATFKAVRESLRKSGQKISLDEVQAWKTEGRR